MWTAEFTEAVDTLIRDASISDDALHARARQCLDLLNESNPAQLSGPLWAQRIQNVIPQIPAFSTLRLFNALYTTADKLRLVAGKRYVSATICACRDRTIPGAVSPDAGQWTNLVQALDDVASTWAAFVLWPFYAHGADIDLTSVEKLQAARDQQQRRWKEQVMARDNYYCFMCGRYETDWFFRQPQSKLDGMDFNDCDVVPIIKREVLAQNEDLSKDITGASKSLDAYSNITRGIIQRYVGADVEDLLEKAVGPQNILLVNTSACHGFRRFRWCLHATKKPNRYKITRYGLPNYLGSRHVTSHVTFVDHSQSHHSPAPAQDGNVPVPVDLPDPALLRLHAVLAGVLWRSGAVAAFDRLFARPSWLPGYSRWPAARGSAFWTSVVEYAGDETCLEVDLELSMDALRESMRTAAIADSQLTHSRDGSPTRD